MTTIVPLSRVHPEDGISAERLSLGTIQVAPGVPGVESKFRPGKVNFEVAC